MSPPTSGIICSPACVGVDPFTICRYCGTIAMPPNMPMPVMTAMIVVSEKTPLRNSRSGSRASSP